MRPSTEFTRDVLSQGDFDHFEVADLVYGGERKIEGLPVSGLSWSEDGDAKIQQSGSCTVVWTDDWATSLSPELLTDPLAPAGAELWLYSVITAGEVFQERVPIGQFRITAVPSAMDEDMLFRGEWITVGSTVEVEFKERLVVVEDDRFDLPEATASLVSVWAEVARISGMQVVRSIADSTIPRTVAYSDERLDAVYDLLALINGIPHVASDGSLAARPVEWPAPVDTLRHGDRGTIVSVGRSMSSAEVYNRVVVRGKGVDQTIVLAVAEIKDGPLRVRNADGSRSPFGQKTYFVSSEYVTTVDQALPWAQKTLAQVSQIRTVVVPVVETFNPLRERGDVIRIERARKFLTGRIKSIRRSSGKATMDMDVEIING